MSKFQQDNIEQIVDVCRENAEAIAEGINLCFDMKAELTVGESASWETASISEEFDGCGLVVAIHLDEQVLLALIPQTLPLPEWYRNPGESESSRLQTLAMEWSMNLIPAEFEANEFASIPVANLKNSVAETKPEEWASCLNLTVTHEESDASNILIIWPVRQAPAAEEKPESPSEIPPDDDETIENSDTENENTVKPAAGIPVSLPRGAARILDLPVKVIVRLAEKKIDMTHLLAMSPGGLITFGKSCEDFLDLYVNNHRYCRGEAVKIGEKFGLKIMEVGVMEHREDPVMHEEE